MMPLVRIPLILQTCCAEIEQKPQLMIADMKIVDDLSLKLTEDFGNGFQLDTYLVLNQKVIEEVVFQFDSVKDQVDMFLSDEVNLVLPKKNLEGILVHLLFEATTHLAMKLHSKTKNLATKFGI